MGGAPFLRSFLPLKLFGSMSEAGEVAGSQKWLRTCDFHPPLGAGSPQFQPLSPLVLCLLKLKSAGKGTPRPGPGERRKERGAAGRGEKSLNKSGAAFGETKNPKDAKPRSNPIVAPWQGDPLNHQGDKPTYFEHVLSWAPPAFCF